jgi:hypothetical protein
MQVWLRVGQALLWDIHDIYSTGLPEKKKIIIYSNENYNKCVLRSWKILCEAYKRQVSILHSVNFIDMNLHIQTIGEFPVLEHFLCKMLHCVLKKLASSNLDMLAENGLSWL